MMRAYPETYGPNPSAGRRSIAKFRYRFLNSPHVSNLSQFGGGLWYSMTSERWLGYRGRLSNVQRSLCFNLMSLRRENDERSNFDQVFVLPIVPPIGKRSLSASVAPSLTVRRLQCFNGNIALRVSCLNARKYALLRLRCSPISIHGKMAGEMPLPRALSVLSGRQATQTPI